MFNLYNLLFILVIYYLLVRPVLRGLAAGLPPRGDAQNILRAIYQIAGEVARADNDESKEEMDTVVLIVRQVLGNPNLPAETILSDYRKFSAQPWSHTDAEKISPRFRNVLLQVAVQVAASDHKITESELRAIRNIGATMNIPPQTIDQLLRAVGVNKRSRQDRAGKMVSAVDYALEVMELNSATTWPEIKKQYKRMAMKCHPDRVKVGGKVAATAKFKELGDAYRILKNHHA